MKKQKPEAYRPDWSTEVENDSFAVRILRGVNKKTDNKHKGTSANKKILSIEEYVNGVVNFDRNILARTITLIESNNPNHQELAQQVLTKLLPYSGNSLRVGITGVPGSGKSTLIESFGMYLIGLGHKVAVLTVDPSSSITKGSILGDKTRMANLSRQENCFIRPSPSGGTLGGVARKSRETITVCEAAGFDIILIETVGVGQSEITVRSMVDFFLLILIAGGGDELQGIKRGIMELVDTILINKADGDNEKKAIISKSDYENALQYLQPATKGWRPKVFTTSAIAGKGIPELWNTIKEFEKITKESGVFEKRRKSQQIEWVHKMVENWLIDEFYSNENVKKMLKTIEEEIIRGTTTPTLAAEKLLKSIKL